jgi:hypothetical protein
MGSLASLTLNTEGYAHILYRISSVTSVPAKYNEISLTKMSDSTDTEHWWLVTLPYRISSVTSVSVKYEEISLPTMSDALHWHWWQPNSTAQDMCEWSSHHSTNAFIVMSDRPTQPARHHNLGLSWKFASNPALGWTRNKLLNLIVDGSWKRTKFGAASATWRLHRDSRKDINLCLKYRFSKVNRRTDTISSVTENH